MRGISFYLSDYVVRCLERFAFYEEMNMVWHDFKCKDLAV